MPSLFSRKGLRYLAAALVVLFLATAALPSSADLSDEIEKLRKEQEAVKKDRAEKAKVIDSTTAEAQDLAAALGVLNGEVNQQEEKLATAEAKLDAAEKRFAEASQAVVDKTSEIETLKGQVSDRAITAFVDQNSGSTPVLRNTDPNQAVRMQSLVQSVTRQEVDSAELLKEAKEDLALEQLRADDAAAEAEELRGTIETELRSLESARDEQAKLAAEAEARLEARLAEQAILEERDKELAATISDKNDELARQAALARKRNNPAPATSTGAKYPTNAQIVQVQGFWVHVDIADNLERMLNAASAEGHSFGGWGYRDHQAQIRLRKAHCGSSEYAIWSKPSSQCRPPTARPGASQHELGKAIDFTYGGSTIGRRSSPGYKWLNANAANYGFYNLPSEPWHWSVNGR